MGDPGRKDRSAAAGLVAPQLAQLVKQIQIENISSDTAWAPEETEKK